MLDWTCIFFFCVRGLAYLVHVTTFRAAFGAGPHPVKRVLAAASGYIAIGVALLSKLTLLHIWPVSTMECLLPTVVHDCCMIVWQAQSSPFQTRVQKYLRKRFIALLFGYKIVCQQRRVPLRAQGAVM